MSNCPKITTFDAEDNKWEHKYPRGIMTGEQISQLAYLIVAGGHRVPRLKGDDLKNLPEFEDGALHICVDDYFLPIPVESHYPAWINIAMSMAVDSSEKHDVFISWHAEKNLPFQLNAWEESQ